MPPGLQSPGSIKLRNFDGSFDVERLGPPKTRRASWIRPLFADVSYGFAVGLIGKNLTLYL